MTSMPDKSHFLKQIVKKTVYIILSPFLKETGPSQSIYITFDDGPHPTHTLEILKILSTHKITATFFFNGYMIEKYPDIVAITQSAGHQIGYPPYHHKRLKEFSSFSIYKDLRLAKQLLKKLNITEFLYRLPYGVVTLKFLFPLIVNKWKIIIWTIEGRDSLDSEKKVIQNINISKITNGAIILLHDVYEKTPRILPVILKNLINARFSPDRFSYK